MPTVQSIPILPGLRIEQDQARYRARLDAAIRGRLPQLLGQVPVVSGRQAVRVPVPYEAVPTFRRAGSAPAEPPATGVGQGPGQPGDIVARRPVGTAAPSTPGTESGGGTETVTVELDPDELQDLVWRNLRLPRLHPRPHGTEVHPAPRWTSRRDRGPRQRLDRAATIRAAARRRIVQGPDAPAVLGVDLRYQSWRTRARPQTQAVVGLVRDVSGSMGPDQTLLCLGIAWWLVGALRRVYDQVALDFWVHHHEARRVAEPAFWTIGPSGGTRAQVAYEAVADAWVTAYPPTGWVWYLVHFSDGEDGDAAGAARVIATRWAPVAALVGLVELRRATEAPAAESRSVLGRALAALPDPPVRVVTVQGPADAGPALQRLFADAPREEGSA